MGGISGKMATATILSLTSGFRRQLGLASVPDPKRATNGDLVAAIDRSHLTLEEIAELMNRVLGTGHICAAMVGSWYRGEAFPPMHYGLVILWIGGLDLAASFMAAQVGLADSGSEMATIG